MKETKPTKRLGLVTASPAQFLVHQRLGRTRFPGRGRSAWLLPWIDRYWLIPSSAHSVSFCADQITAENQGVEISGFAIWNVENPERAVESVDFTDPAEAVEKIGQNLREVVESAIRHQVANLSLEDALRKRGSIIVQLKKELADVADRWGIGIATVEIKTVRIMSAQLFENMQARFRDAVRLESERSAMETNEAIAKGNAAVQEETARRELEFQQADVRRKEALRRSQIATEQALLELEAALDNLRFTREHQRMTNRLTISGIEDAMERGKIETSNTRDTARMFVEKLPELLSGVNIGKINLGDPLLAETINRFAQSLSRPRRTGGLYSPGDE